MAKKNQRGAHRKPRQQKLVFTMDKAGSGNIQILPGGEVRIVSDTGQSIEPRSAHLSVLHRRESGKDKVITRGPAMPSAMSIDANEILRPFALIVAVDTNTRIVRDTRISCTVVVLARWAENGRLDCIPIGAAEAHDVTGSPERLGWHYAISNLAGVFSRPPELRRSNGSARPAIAVIVDSDLGALDAINERTAPYFGELFLPPGFTMIYGSSDVGAAEFVANRAMSTCDKVAGHILRNIEANATMEGPEEGPSQQFRRFRTYSVTAEEVV